ncbi:MAG: anthranilate phosphoribosyltransferase [Gammaproteobacteria bacterium]|nr:anthranilate phosphoribosyltransferase [Gammaproteobacteria bacterium]
MNITKLITKMIAHEDLTYEQMREAMFALMSGETNDMQTAGFLTALATKGETSTEIYAAAEIMRELSDKVEVSNCESLVDPVGTGGSYSRVFNVSTASAIVAACAGVTIAKHGSRSASSKSGSADLLEAAGVNIELTPDEMKQCVEKFGIGFMYAPLLHSAMRHVMPARKATGVRTIFNLIGPLTNPSGAKCQVLGVFDKKWLKPMAEVAQKLGQHRVMVVNSNDGLDELSIVDKTYVAELVNNNVNEYIICPKSLGIHHESLDGVRVNSAEESLFLIKEAFQGVQGPAFDMIALNAAAILYVAGKCDDLKSGINNTQEIMKSGRAYQKLEEYAAYTQQFKR